jgi:hypothetical protein
VSFRCLCLTAGIQAPSAVMEKPEELVMSAPSPTRLPPGRTTGKFGFHGGKSDVEGGTGVPPSGKSCRVENGRRGGLAKLLPSGSRTAATRCGLARLEVMPGELERRDQTARFLRKLTLWVFYCCVLAGA